MFRESAPLSAGISIVSGVDYEFIGIVEDLCLTIRLSSRVGECHGLLELFVE